MKYIFLVAGKGSRLHPLTLKQPKSLFRLDSETTVLQRMVDLIKKNDSEADIIVVNGFMRETIEAAVDGVTFVYNPFYAVTNSIGSLWFAKEHLDSENVTLINGDIVMEEELVQEVLCKKTDKPKVLLDSSIQTDGDYNVQVNGDKVLVMSKELDTYAGEYAGVTKLDRKSALALRNFIERMVADGMYEQWYENALVQMIFEEDFDLYYEDISNYKWTEVDCVGDMLLAKQIHLESKR